MPTVAIILIVIIVLYFILSLVFKKKPLIKIPLIVLVLCIAFLFLSSKFSSSSPQAEIPSYQLNAPDKSKAPKVIATSSLIYYVKGFLDDGRIVNLIDYYFYDGKQWQHGSYPLPLDRKYVAIKIYER